jgi:hypothetical protein
MWVASLSPSTLPDDVWRLALSYLCLEDMKTVTTVCSKFKHMLYASPFHAHWSNMVIDERAASWRTPCNMVTRSSRHAREHDVHAVVPRVLCSRGIVLHTLQLGHRLYPRPNPLFGSPELRLVADACYFLRCLRIYYSPVSITLAGLRYLVDKCPLLHTLDMPASSVQLRSRFAAASRRQEPVGLTSCITSMRLHNMEPSPPLTMCVAQLFTTTLRTLRLVNVENLVTLNFLASFRALEHLTLKHCRRPATFADNDHNPITSHSWYNVLSRLHTLCVVDVDHVVCERRVVSSIVSSLVIESDFRKLKELRIDDNLGHFMDHLPVDLVLACDRCEVTMHPFNTWQCFTRCDACRRDAGQKLESLFLYNHTLFPLHDVAHTHAWTTVA